MEYLHSVVWWVDSTPIVSGPPPRPVDGQLRRRNRLFPLVTGSSPIRAASKGWSWRAGRPWLRAYPRQLCSELAAPSASITGDGTGISRAAPCHRGLTREASATPFVPRCSPTIVASDVAMRWRSTSSAPVSAKGARRPHRVRFPAGAIRDVTASRVTNRRFATFSAIGADETSGGKDSTSDMEKPRTVRRERWTSPHAPLSATSCHVGALAEVGSLTAPTQAKDYGGISLGRTSA